MLNAQKCIIGPSVLPLIGRLVGPDSIRIDPDRLGSLPTMRAHLRTRRNYIHFWDLCSTLLHSFQNYQRRRIFFLGDVEEEHSL